SRPATIPEKAAGNEKDLRSVRNGPAASAAAARAAVMDSLKLSGQHTIFMAEPFTSVSTIFAVLSHADVKAIETL
ncbi:hypothetical protein, partial [Actinotignum sanguinis]|uniref:hypothetical protein n=1 Tax=Actinotignum sanguinis TaxID=1445614 RepID=UPI002A80BC77